MVYCLHVYAWIPAGSALQALEAMKSNPGTKKGTWLSKVPNCVYIALY